MPAITSEGAIKLLREALTEMIATQPRANDGLAGGHQFVTEDDVKACRKARQALAVTETINTQVAEVVPMRDDTFTVIPQNMVEYQMSVREPDNENDLFREAFEDACREDKPDGAKESLFAWDFFKYGWLAAIRCLATATSTAAPISQSASEQFPHLYVGNRLTGESKGYVIDPNNDSHNNPAPGENVDFGALIRAAFPRTEK